MIRKTNEHRGRRVQGVADIGTSKIAAAIIVPSDDAQNPFGFRIAGLGLQKSKGVKAGVLVDLDDAETALRAAIAQAERAAGVTVEGVTVSIACGRLKSQHFAASTETETGVVSDEDLQRLMAAGRAYGEREGRTLLHMNHLGFKLDSAAGIADPRGLSGHKMSAQFHAVNADEAPVRNVLLLIERCFLECQGLVAAPYASALAVTAQEDRDIGVTCIDLGAGTSSIAQFADGKFIGAEVVPVGSQHISFDVARALQTSIGEAERLKTLYGSLFAAQSDEHETFSYGLTDKDTDEASTCSRAQLAEIVRPRITQISGLLRDRLSASPANAYAGERIVLTGGASQLIGIGELMTNELGRPVSVAAPQGVPGLGQSVSGPQFATLVGLARAAAAGGADIEFEHQRRQQGQGYLGRVGTWLKTGF
jgi:cell division protein FtsA